MLTDAKIKSLKIEDGKRHADRDGLVVELRPSGKEDIKPKGPHCRPLHPARIFIEDIYVNNVSVR